MYVLKRIFIYTQKTPHRLLDEEFILNIQFYFNIVPIVHTSFCGLGIEIFLCVLESQCELSEVEIITYFLPLAIAACGAASRAIKSVLKLFLTVRLIWNTFSFIWLREKGAGVRWTPLYKTQKHRPRRQPRT